MTINFSVLLHPSRLKNQLVLKSNTSRFENEDLVPLPDEKRTWTSWSFFAYWWSESWNVSTWIVGSSAVVLGISARDAILIVLFANLLSAVVIVLNARAAARYRVGFPVLARTSWGMYGHYFPVVLRALLGIIWGGVQLYYQGQFIAIMISCIFSSFRTMKNTIPPSQGITLQELIGYIVAFVITLPFMFIPTHKIRHLFTAKTILMPIAGMAIVVWATSENGGVSVDMVQDTSRRRTRMKLAFSIISQFNAVMGTNSALLVTVPDISRYSKSPNSQVVGQLVGLPLAQTLCSTFGIITTSAVLEMWGEAFWNPYNLLNAILNRSYTSGARAGVFFASFAWAFATLGSSIACNIIPFAADITCLLPKYINIIRGQVLCLIIAFAIVPWKIVGTQNGFLTFLSGYSIFQGSIVGIMLVDYFMLRKGNIEMNSLYSTSHYSRYFYKYGYNWRAFFAFIIGFSIPFPGFIDSFPNLDVSTAAQRMFTLGWLISFMAGSLSYFIFGTLFSKPYLHDKNLPFESLANAPDNTYYSSTCSNSAIESKSAATTTTTTTTQQQQNEPLPSQINQIQDMPGAIV